MTDDWESGRHDPVGQDVRDEVTDALGREFGERLGMCYFGNRPEGPRFVVGIIDGTDDDVRRAMELVGGHGVVVVGRAPFTNGDMWDFAETLSLYMWQRPDLREIFASIARRSPRGSGGFVVGTTRELGASDQEAMRRLVPVPVEFVVHDRFRLLSATSR